MSASSELPNDFPGAQRIPFVDAVRGAALFLMCFDHIARYLPALHPVLEHTFGLFAGITMMEVFLLTTAFTFSHAYMRGNYNNDDRRLLLRIFRLFQAHVFLSFAVALSFFLKPSLFPEVLGTWEATFLQTFLQALTFRFLPHYLDILPVYLFCLLMFLLILRFSKGREICWKVILPISCLIWVATQLLPFPGTLRSLSHLVLPNFNPFSYQFLFILGVYAYTRFYKYELNERLRVRLLILSTILLLTLMLCRVLFPDIFQAGELWYSRPRLGVLRLLELVFALVLFRTMKTRFVGLRTPRFLQLLGRNSFAVFVSHVVLMLLWEVAYADHAFRWNMVAQCLNAFLMLCLLPIVAYLGSLFSRNYEKCIRLSFWAVLALVPVLISQAFLESFQDLKLGVLALIPGIVFLFVRAKRMGLQEFSVTVYEIGLVAILSFQILSLLLSNITNLGLQIQQPLLLVVALSMSIFLRDDTSAVTALFRALFLPLILTLAGSLFMILNRAVLFSNYSPFGAAIGLKNSVSVFLAAAVPLLLVGEQQFAQMALRNRRKNVFCRLIFALLVLCIWVVIANRTRSAWLMLILYCFGLIVLAFVERQELYRQSLQRLVAAFVLACCCLYVIPHSLHWNSASPYWDSMSTLFSYEHSSGRDSLWKIGFSFFPLNPVRGIGPGNFALHWRQAIAANSIDPKLFSFLRPDLPLFQDYLQNAIECGWLSAGFYLTSFLLLPIFLFFRVRDPVQRLLAFIPCGIALDAMFDYPFQRAETFFIFASVMCILATNLPRLLTVSRRFVLTVLLLFSFLCGSFSFRIIGATVLKRFGESVTAVEESWRLWPYSFEWRIETLERLLSEGRIDFAREYSEARAKHWPEDPESYLVLARLNETEGHFLEALEFYRRAILRVAGGRCYERGYQSYLKFQERTDLPSNLTKLTERELGECRR